MQINGVFQGGGVKGISLVGAVKAAEMNDVWFDRLAGTSSGSIVAAFIAAGFKADEMKEIIMDSPFTQFLKRAPIFNVAYIGPALRILLKNGLYSGEALEHWIREILLRKGIRTFDDLDKGKLSIVASNITNGQILVLPDDLDKLGISPQNFEVAKAVRMSCSIPYFFDPVVLRLGSQQAKGLPFREQFIYVVDGGLLSNLPLWLFDQEGHRPKGKLVPTVGFRMVGNETGRPHQIRGPISMLGAIVETMLSAHDERYIDETKIYRTIKIPTLGVNTTQFDLSKKQSLELYESGYQAGRQFFDSWNAEHYETKFVKYQQALKV